MLIKNECDSAVFPVSSLQSYLFCNKYQSFHLSSGCAWITELNRFKKFSICAIFAKLVSSWDSLGTLVKNRVLPAQKILIKVVWAGVQNLVF